MKVTNYGIHLVKRSMFPRLSVAVHVAHAFVNKLVLGIKDRLNPVEGEHIVEVLPGDVLVSGTYFEDPFEESIIVVARELNPLCPRRGFMDLSPEDLRALSCGSALVFGEDEVQTSRVLRVGKEVVQVTYLNDHFRLQFLDKRNRFVCGFVAVEGKVNVAKDNRFGLQFEHFLSR